MIKILIAEDDATILELLLDVLNKFGEDKGFECHGASDGAVAKNMIDEGINQGFYYNILLTDLRMPEVNGKELLEYYKRTTDDGVIVVISAEVELKNDIKSIPSVVKVLNKPVSSRAVCNTIGSIISTKDYIGANVSENKLLNSIEKINKFLEGK